MLLRHPLTVLRLLFPKKTYAYDRPFTKKKHLLKRITLELKKNTPRDSQQQDGIAGQNASIVSRRVLFFGRRVFTADRNEGKLVILHEISGCFD